MPSYSGTFTLPAQMQAKAADNWPLPPPPPPSIGEVYGGGYFAGQISTAGNGVVDYYLVVGPVASTQTFQQWKNEISAVTGADSDIDGPQNTADMVGGGSSGVYPAAHYCNNLTVGGFTDWYMPSKNELEVCYYNLKGTTTNNVTTAGINPNAVPPRASNYTAGTPAQTSVTIFQTTGAEKFTEAYYWSSTSDSATVGNAWRQYFYSGSQIVVGFIGNARTRAVRRVAV